MYDRYGTCRYGTYRYEVYSGIDGIIWLYDYIWDMYVVLVWSRCSTLYNGLLPWYLWLYMRVCSLSHVGAPIVHAWLGRQSRVDQLWVFLIVYIHSTGRGVHTWSSVSHSVYTRDMVDLGHFCPA